MINADLNGPTAVILWMRDGTEREEVFATRFQAEVFVYLLPYLATTLPDDAENGVAAAAGLEPAAWLTKLLTALVVAGGSNLLHDLWPTGGQLEPLQLEIIDDDGSMTTISQ
jgi:hypothetical protein